MTHKFEFGDKVRHKLDPESIGIVIVPVTSLGLTTVWFDGHKNHGDFCTGNLEPS